MQAGGSERKYGRGQGKKLGFLDGWEGRLLAPGLRAGPAVREGLGTYLTTLSHLPISCCLLPGWILRMVGMQLVVQSRWRGKRRRGNVGTPAQCSNSGHTLPQGGRAAARPLPKCLSDGT